MNLYFSQGRSLKLPYALVNGQEIELQTVSLSPRIFFIPQFVTDEEAELIIQESSDKMAESYVFDAGKRFVKRKRKPISSSLFVSVVLEARNSRQAWLMCDPNGSAASRAVCAMVHNEKGPMFACFSISLLGSTCC